MFVGGFGFFSGGAGGGGGGGGIDPRQELVGAGAPSPIVDGSSTYTPSVPISGDGLLVYVNGGGYLQPGVDFSTITSGSTITSITLLLGRKFNLMEYWTFIGYTT